MSDPLLESLLERWRTERAWMRYQISQRVDQFFAAYPRRQWRVYPVERIRRERQQWLEVRPVHPVPGAPETWADDPRRSWEWKLSGVVAGKVFTALTGTPTTKNAHSVYWSWGLTGPPPVAQLVSTDAVGFPMSQGKARAFRQDFVTIQSMLEYYGWLTAWLRQAAAVLAQPGERRRALRQGVIDRREHSLRMEAKYRAKAGAKAHSEPMYEPAALTGIGPTVERLLPDLPQDWATHLSISRTKKDAHEVLASREDTEGSDDWL